jgi:hypothetical protein
VTEPCIREASCKAASPPPPFQTDLAEVQCYPRYFGLDSLLSIVANSHMIGFVDARIVSDGSMTIFGFFVKLLQALALDPASLRLGAGCVAVCGSLHMSNLACFEEASRSVKTELRDPLLPHLRRGFQNTQAGGSVGHWEWRCDVGEEMRGP